MKKLAKPKREVPKQRIIFIWDNGEGKFDFRGLTLPLNNHWKGFLETSEKLWQRLVKRGVIV